MFYTEKCNNLESFRSPETASIEMIRRSMSLPEKEAKKLIKRAFDEEDSLTAEGLKGHLDSYFDYQLVDGQLVAEDGEPLLAIAQKGIEYYLNQIQNDPRYIFLLERSVYEKQEDEIAEQLSKEEISATTIIRISAYPEEAENLYGKDFVQSLGFHTDIKRALIRAIEKTPGGVRMHTRSVDSSSLAVWNKLLPEDLQAKTTEELLSHQLYFNSSAIDVLDSLQVAYENHINVSTTQRRKKSVWEFMKSRDDLTNHFRNEMTKLSNSHLNGEDLRIALNRLRRNYWSAMKESYDAHNDGFVYMEGSNPSEIFTSAGATTESRRESLVVCGMEIKPFDEMTTKEILTEVFSDKDILKCVKCPYCNKTVDAKITNSTISCLGTNKSGGCGAIVDKKTGKRIDKTLKYANNHKVIDMLGSLLIEIFSNNKNQKTK